MQTKKTIELTGNLLDYYVAKAQGLELPLHGSYDYMNLTVYVDSNRTNEDGDLEIEEYHPSSNWAHCGPLIEEWKIDLFRHEKNNWEAEASDEHVASAENPLEAICRAVVLAKFGEEVLDV